MGPCMDVPHLIHPKLPSNCFLMLGRRQTFPHLYTDVLLHPPNELGYVLLSLFFKEGSLWEFLQLC